MNKRPSAKAKKIAQRANKPPRAAEDGHAPATEEMNQVADMMAAFARRPRADVCKPIAARLEEQRHRVFELGAIVKIVNEALNGFSGDESSLDIVVALSTYSFALEGAYRLSNLVNEQLELIGREFE